MPERPLVLFGKPDDAARYKITGYPPPPHLPSYSRQKERLSSATSGVAIRFR